MKSIGKYLTGIIISIALIGAGAYLISRAGREYEETITIIDPSVYSGASEEQMISEARGIRTETRIIADTNYFYLTAGIGLIFFTGGYWLYRFVSAGKRKTSRREERF